MTADRIPVNDPQRRICCDVGEMIRANTALPQIVRHLRATTIGDSDLRWNAAVQAEGQARADSELAARTSRTSVIAMLLAARAFFATVLDGQARRVPRILAHAMNGILPSDLERRSDREKLHALRSLITFIGSRTDLSFDAGALAALVQSVDTAESAMVQAIAARGEWHARVTTKRAETLAFDEGYKAFVGCLRSTGGSEQLRALLPSFVRRGRTPVEEPSLPPTGASVQVEVADDPGVEEPESAETTG